MADYGYARVSTVGQSLDAQLEQLKDTDIIFQEKISGAKRDRPELDSLLACLKPGDVVVVCKMDRLARSTKDLLEIVDVINGKKASLKILNIQLDTSTPTGRLMMTMLGAIAEFERAMMLERQSEGIARAKKEGKYKGRFPSAQAKATQMLTLSGQGVSYEKIAADLGVSKSSVCRVLKRVKG